MWNKLVEKFEKYPAQAKVLKLLFERGFQVNEEGKVTSGNIEIAHTQLAREAGVDRRVVDATTKTIISDEFFSAIFKNVHSIPFLRDVAPSLGLGVIIIIPEDAANMGILAEVAGVTGSSRIASERTI